MWLTQLTFTLYYPYNQPINMKPLFRYAILTDTHIRPPDLSSSPWRTNLLTNERAQHIAQAINTHSPDLVIHLGDIVHPVPHLPSHRAASMVAEEIMNTLEAPYYLVPGNHDIGDKHNPTVPAHTVNQEFIDYYREHYGPTYQSFTHKNIHFIILNTPVLNSGLPEEQEQREWLEKNLETHHGERIHVFSHYPPYLHTPDEPNNYDNLDQPARAWLLDLLKKHRVEAYYAGHIHQYFHKKHGDTTITNLLATGNLRQDYATMFNTSPAEEHGRNDTPKLGYCIVDIYPDTHITHIKRSYGRIQPPPTNTIDQYYPTPATHSPLGVELRYPLAETNTLPYMGPLDEYLRKTARNDYTYLALWETGIRALRIPLTDLTIPETRTRLSELHSQGFRYIFFHLETPPTSLVTENKELIETLEIITPWSKAETIIGEASALRNTGVPVIISRIESSIDRPQKGTKFSHTMATGFQATDLEEIPDNLDIDGYSFQVTQNQPPLETIQQITEHALAHNYKPQITVKLAPDNPAEYPQDDNHHANRAAEALIAAYQHPQAQILLDAFTDHDRGYYPRHGLYDRLINPRKPAKVLRNLDAALTTHGTKIANVHKETGYWTIISFTTHETIITLNLPHTNTPKDQQGTTINLETGEINQKTPLVTQHLTIKPKPD